MSASSAASLRCRRARRRAGAAGSRRRRATSKRAARSSSACRRRPRRRGRASGAPQRQPLARLGVEPGARRAGDRRRAAARAATPREAVGATSSLALRPGRRAARRSAPQDRAGSRARPARSGRAGRPADRGPAVRRAGGKPGAAPAARSASGRRRVRCRAPACEVSVAPGGSYARAGDAGPPPAAPARVIAGRIGGRMQAAELMVRCLEAEGVKHIFASPARRTGDVDVARRSPIEFVICRHEQGAAFMADVYGRMTGGRACAWARWAPARRTSSRGWPTPTSTRADGGDHRPGSATAPPQGDPPGDGRGRHVRPVTKWAATIGTRETVGGGDAQGVQDRRAENPGADLTRAVGDIAGTTRRPADRPWRQGRAAPVRRERRVRGAILLANAQRPIVLAGNGACAPASARSCAVWRQAGMPAA